MIALKFGVSGEGHYNNGEATTLLFFICAYVAAYAWSWGPLGWLIPSEICSLEVRFAGQGTNVACKHQPWVVYLFGYDLGITGGVTSMETFLIKFFPSVYKQMKGESNHESQYCKFNNQLLTLFTSSLYLAALVASFFASTTTRMMGRKTSMFAGGLFFLLGALINGFAINIQMLIIGRLFLGFGVGYSYAWSWGPLGWLVPSEICSLEVRSAGQGTNVACKHVIYLYNCSSFSTHALSLEVWSFLLLCLDLCSS
ncbi:hypothetical protein ACSQ67_011471 [Phaseolus vulgaris]